MKIRTSLFLTLASFAAIILIACNDDIGSTGISIQPDGDDIFVGSDTIALKAETVSYQDSIYANTIYGLLGEYVDPIFGKVKSDYLCEFHTSQDQVFRDRVIDVDSVFLNTEFTYFTGDTVSPMGVSIYEIQNPLKAYFFTNIDPAKYTGSNPRLYGQSFFAIQDCPDTVMSSVRYRYITTKLDTSIGKDFLEEWKRNPETFNDDEKFREFFKGIYVTTTFGSGSVINVNYTELFIRYRYNVTNAANDGDSVVQAVFRLPVTSDVRQMNRVQNDIPESLYKDTINGMTYMKTPAGVYTQLTVPLDTIKRKVGQGWTINAANLKIKGYTEKEAESSYLRPANVLLINKDSLPNFFLNKKSADNITSFTISRNTTTNTYDLENKLASIINHYSQHYKDRENLPDLKYLLIPIQISYTYSSSGSATSSRISNLMYPTSAILRTDPDNMKMSLIFSKYNK